MPKAPSIFAALESLVTELTAAQPDPDLIRCVLVAEAQQAIERERRKRTKQPKGLTLEQKAAVERLLQEAFDREAEYIDDDWTGLLDTDTMQSRVYWGHLADALKAMGAKGAALNLATNMHRKWQTAMADAAAFEKQVRETYV